ncbi:MAG: hypothetical protein RL377_3 [Bacteroidota bacterium]|jgi:hypothetical protein
MKISMRKNYTNILGFTMIMAFVMLLAPACKKDVASAELELTYKMLSDKRWFLDYTQTITGSTVTQRTYVGQASYFISFYSNRTTVDSDGIRGTYSVTNTNGQLGIKVVGTTPNNSAVEYSYKAESIGTSTLVLSNVVGSTTTKYYYTAQ